MVIVFWGDWHTHKCRIPAIGYVSRLSCYEKQRNLQRCEVSEALRVDRLSKMEARGLADFNYCMCSLENFIPQCHDDKFRPDTIFDSGVVHLRRVHKSSRIPLAENLKPKIHDICETPSNAYCSPL